jgi:hypothetical protein
MSTNFRVALMVGAVLSTLWTLTMCRVTHRPLKHEDISYSDTGNGFIVDCYGLKMTFTKQPYVKSWETYADIKAGVEYEKRSKKQQTAADILAGL